MNAVRFLALLFLLASFPGLLNAQEEPEIQAGERVRFQYRLPGTGRPTAAQGVFLAKDSMFFSFQGQESTDTLSVPLAQIIEVEVLRGVTTAAGRGVEESQDLADRRRPDRTVRPSVPREQCSR